MIKKIISAFKKKQFYSANLNQILGSFESSAFKYNFTASDFLRIAGNTYNRNSDFREAVGKITTACLSLPLCIKDDKGMVQDLLLSPEVMNFIRKPMASNYDWKSFIEACLIQYFISGEIFLLDYRTEFVSSDELTSLFLVWPSEVNKIKYKSGIPYEYKVSSAFFRRVGIPNTGIANYISEFKNGRLVNDIIHYKNLNPISTERGLSPVIALLDDVEILVKGRKWNRAVLHNEGRPSGVFFYPPNSSQSLNPEGGRVIGKNKVNEEIKQNFSGSGNAGKSLFLRGGLQFKEIEYKMKDVDFLAGLKFSRESIANALGIPLQMFGSQEKSSYNNMTEARQIFHNNTCIPLMENFLSWLSSDLLYKAGILKEGSYLSIDRDKTDIANQLRLEKMQKYDLLNFLTINEKREFCGMDKVNDMNSDVILQPQNLSPIDELGMGADNIQDEDEDEDEDDDE